MRITPITKVREVYSDLTKDLFRNPVNFDITRKTNEEAVKEAIKNLILTDRGERLMQPNIGGDVRRMLFENWMPGTIRVVEEKIRNVIETYEPRAELLDISVIGLPDSNSAQINITFAINMVENPISFSVVVERIR